MPALDQYMREAATIRAEQQQVDIAESERLERANAAENYAKLDALCKLPEFQWFLAEMVSPIVNTAMSNALDAKKTPEDRNNHCQQYNMANDLLKLANNKREFYKQQSGIEG